MFAQSLPTNLSKYCGLPTIYPGVFFGRVVVFDNFKRHGSSSIKVNTRLECLFDYNLTMLWNSVSPKNTAAELVDITFSKSPNFTTTKIPTKWFTVDM